MIIAHRKRALTPDAPVIRGTSQNPDVYFQARETVNRYYDESIRIVEEEMERFADLTGREYKIMEYHGAADADRVVVIMGSGAETAAEVAKNTSIPTAKRWVWWLFGFTAPSLLSTSWEFSPIPSRKLLCSTAPRNQVPSANRFSRMLLARFGSRYFERYFPLPADAPRDRRKVWPFFQGLHPAMVKGVFDELGKDQPRNALPLASWTM